MYIYIYIYIERDINSISYHITCGGRASRDHGDVRAEPLVAGVREVDLGGGHSC